MYTPVGNGLGVKNNDSVLLLLLKGLGIHLTALEVCLNTRVPLSGADLSTILELCQQSVSDFHHGTCRQNHWQFVPHLPELACDTGLA